MDSLTKQKLAFVNIIVNDDLTFGTTTDIDGNFTIKSKTEVNSLSFSYVGYKKKTVSVEKREYINVLMNQENIELQEVVIHAGENPAHRIIDSLVKYRRKNNPEMLDSYSYTIYDRMILTFDTTLITDSALLDFNKLVRNNDIMVMETVSEQYHKKPNKNKREIKANIVSGLNNPMYFYVLDGMQSTSFYDDFITVYEKNYVNPIAPGSKSKYFFILESVMPTIDNDSIYTISFKPRRGTTFEALKGVMTVTSDGWAVVNVKAEAADKKNSIDVKIQQLYTKVNDSVWFPIQLNTDIVFMKMFAQKGQISLSTGSADHNTSLNGIGKSYISNIEINPVIDKKVFGSIDIDVNENSTKHNDDFWLGHREDGVNKRITNTYRFIDTVLAENKINFDKIMDASNSIISQGNIPVGCFDLPLSNIINYNIGNKFYLGLGLKTNEKISKIFDVGGYAGYWFGAKTANYGGGLNIYLNKKRDFTLKLNYDRCFQRVGDYSFIDGYYNPLDENGFKFYFVKWTTLNTSSSAELSMRFAKIFKGFVNFSFNEKQMYDWYSYNSGDSVYNGNFRSTTLDFKLRIAFGERYMLSPKGLVTLQQGKPIIWLSYKKSLKGVFDSPFNFDRINFQLSYSWLMRYIGKSTVVLQAGYAFGDLPIMEMFNIFSSNANSFDIYADEVFATMLINEFFCDRFVSLFFNHNFGKLLKTKYLSPELIFATNIGWGDISDANKHDGVTLKSMKDGYYESGIIIDNILKINISKFGLGVFYRYGANSFDNIADNFAYRLKLAIKF